MTTSGPCPLVSTPLCSLGNLNPGQTFPTFLFGVTANTVSNKTASANTFSGTPDPDSSNNNDSATISVSALRTEALTLTYRSRLTVYQRTAQVLGQIRINESVLHETQSGAQSEFRLSLNPGTIRFQGFLEDDREVESGTWAFDFSGSQQVVPGSVLAEFPGSYPGAWHFTIVSDRSC